MGTDPSGLACWVTLGTPSVHHNWTRHPQVIPQHWFISRQLTSNHVSTLDSSQHSTGAIAVLGDKEIDLEATELPVWGSLHGAGCWHVARHLLLSYLECSLWQLPYSGVHSRNSDRTPTSW